MIDERKLQEALADQAFVAQLMQLDEPADVQKAFAAKGVELTIEEIEAIARQLNTATAQGELDDDAMEGVSGGIAPIILGPVVLGGMVAAWAVTKKW